MADSEKFYQHDARYDLWAVIFSNKQALSKYDITRIFSKFGQIKNIIQTGNSTGFCIVKFAHEDSAKKCVISGPQERCSIPLMPWREKSDQSAPPVPSNLQRNSDANATPNEPQENYQLNNRSETLNDSNSKTSMFNGSSSPNVQNPEVCNTRSNRKGGHLKLQIPPRKPNISESQSRTSELRKACGGIKSPSPLALRLDRARQMENAISMILNEVVPEGLPELIKKPLSVDRGYAWYCNGPCCRGKGGPEVIVANMDEKCNSVYLKKLFGQLDPISVSRMAMYQNVFLYCHVYFRTYEQALNAETIYDRMNVFGKDLIVLTPQSVIAQASCV